MKKFWATTLLVTLILLKGISASAQSSYEMGYIAGYEYAMDRLKAASDAHPEWSLVLITTTREFFGSEIITYGVAQDDYQNRMLSVNSVNRDYGSYFESMRNVSPSWNGYYDGWVQATVDFVLFPNGPDGWQ